MPLKLQLKSRNTIPIDVRRLSAAISKGLSTAEFATINVFGGKRSMPVNELFKISGELIDDGQLIIGGDLDRVHSIGRGLSGGHVIIQSDTGRHVGASMSGGRITIEGNTGDYLGAEMTGGIIEVTGDAGDFVGANLSGAKYGMDRGEIIIQGNAGSALGRRMRRGMIVVVGDVGQLTAWNMLAGTIVVFGKASAKTATDIQRGTVILAGENTTTSRVQAKAKTKRHDQILGDAFSAGGTSAPQIVSFLAHWLKRTHSQTLAEIVDLKLLGRSFVQYNGVELNQNRAEIFVAV